MAIKRKTYKKRNTIRNKRKMSRTSNRNKTILKRNKSKRNKLKKRNKSRRKLYKNQKGGLRFSNMVSHGLLNAARHIPHIATNTVHSLLGNETNSGFLPWQGHYA